MGMMDSMSICASGMTAERLRMDVIASNLANVNTTRASDGSLAPYRRRIVELSPREQSFDDVLGGFSQPEESVGAGVQVSGITTDTTPFKRVYDPGNPDADKTGYVATPNINTVTEMVDMMGATRAYEANVAAVDAIKGMAQKALEIGRA